MEERMDLSVEQLLAMARERKWTIWTQSQCSLVGWPLPVISASPFFSTDPIRETLYSMPEGLLCDVELRRAFLRDMNRLGGWDEMIVRKLSSTLASVTSSVRTAMTFVNINTISKEKYLCRHDFYADQPGFPFAENRPRKVYLVANHSPKFQLKTTVPREK